MSKALDSKNATARKKAKDQPYYKAEIEYERACPYCDAFLWRDHADFNGFSCDCGYWTYRITSNELVYTKGNK